METSILEIQRVADAVRRRVLEHTLRQDGGYLSQACSSAEILATLYMRVMRLGPSEGPPVPGPFAGVPGPRNPGAVSGARYNGPFAPELDRFVFSPVHYALVLYAVLIEVGRLAPEALEQFNRDGSTVELIGAEHSPGHEVTAGSLGQALSQAAGLAMARRLRGDSGRVWTFMSDGELQEGQTWEAVAAAAWHGLDNLGAYVDANAQQCDGAMADVMTIEPAAERLRSFGAEVVEVDGHDVEALIEAGSRRPEGRPLFVLCRTDPCRGLPRLRERAPKLHYVRFRDAEERAEWERVLAQMGGGLGSGVEEKAAKGAGAGTGRSVGVLERVTRPHRTHLVEWARDRAEVLVLSADLTSSCEADLFRDTYPHRFYSMGMAEQNMIGFAGGLAREGYHPYVHTFGVFLTRRPYDQVAMSVAYPNLPVRLLGFLPGLTTPGGVTHQAIDDVAVMRSMPNMTVLECGDATEVESVLDVAEAIDGPVYVRMLRGEVPRLFPASEPMRLGQVRRLSDGRDLTIVTAGICTEEALRACAALRHAGLTMTHLHVSTHAPFPAEVVADAAASARHGVIAMENHSVVGGLGSAVAEVMAEAGVGRRLMRLGVPGVYAHGASRRYLLAEYGLDARALARAAEALCDGAFSLAELDDAMLIASDEPEPTSPAVERPEDL